MTPEPESPAQEEKAPTGVLQRLQDENMQKARKTIMRLHRNLGHPSRKELVRLLQSKRASSSLIQAAQEHKCPLCELHQ